MANVFTFHEEGEMHDSWCCRVTCYNKAQRKYPVVFHITLSWMKCNEKRPKTTEPYKSQIKTLIENILITHERVVKGRCRTPAYHNGYTSQVKFS